MTQAQLWMAAGALALLAGLSGLAEWTRGRRRNLDKPGWMPWTLVQVAAMILALLCLALALKG
jgi:hypothetical protein